MSNLLSSISGQFGRSIILGAFFPAAIFTLLSLILIWPILPANLAVVTRLSGLDTEWQVAVLTAISITIAGLLHNFNITILRYYEGYPWRNFWLLNRLQYRQQQRHQTLKQRTQILSALIKKREQTDPFRYALTTNTALANEAFDTLKERRQLFPDRVDLVLPTDLGNRLRKSEMYAEREFGIAAVNMWPRLMAVVDERYAVNMDNIKTSLNFSLNCSLLSFCLALLVSMTRLIYRPPLAQFTLWISWLATVFFLVLLGWFFYRLSVGRASAWGRMIESAFDLYRWKLLKQLGFKQTPPTRTEERDLWQKISRQIIIGDSPRGSYVEHYDGSKQIKEV